MNNDQEYAQRVREAVKETIRAEQEISLNLRHAAASILRDQIDLVVLEEHLNHHAELLSKLKNASHPTMKSMIKLKIEQNARSQYNRLVEAGASEEEASQVLSLLTSNHSDDVEDAQYEQKDVVNVPRDASDKRRKPRQSKKTG